MPRDYISIEIDRRVREAAKDSCGYCLSPQWLVMARLEIEHIVPVVLGGTNDESNLWLSCPLCNRAKAGRNTAVDPSTNAVESLFNPRMQRWGDHFCWSPDGLRIVGTTAIGRATVRALHLDNDPDAMLVRSYWITAGWHPPQE